MAWLDGWSYRKSVILSRASGAVTNYQMKLLVGESTGATGENVDCGARCQTNFNDLRFTTSDGTTLLDYWIESITGVTPNQLATVWIEFDFISTGDTTFYMYYGPSPVRHVAYNGKDLSGYYKIGLASGDGLDYGFEKNAGNPIISEGPSNYDLHGVMQPFIVKLSSQWIMYYSALSNTNVFSVAVATSTNGLNWTKYASNPILQVGSGGQWDDVAVQIPSVFDTGVVGSKRFRMLYTGYDGATYQIGYAYSADGLSWTKGASNPVIPIGAGGSWEDTYTGLVSNIVLIGSTYYTYYSGHDGTRWQTGLVTFTDFEGEYTKHGSNPVITSRTSAKQTLTAQTNSGTKIVTVADSSVFQPNESVFLCDGTGSGENNEFNRIDTIDSPTQITLQDNVVRNYPHTTSTIRSWFYGSNNLSYFTKDGNSWKGWFSAFQALTVDYASIQKEATAYMTSSDGLSWTMDYLHSPAIPFDPETSTWDEESVENPRLIDLPIAVNGVSSGADTFPLFDDFERGANGDDIGGIWTITTGSAKISTEQKYGGTRSDKLVGGAVQPNTQTSFTATSNDAIMLRFYKEDAATIHVASGDGVKTIYVYVDASENIYYYTGISNDTGVNVVPDSWQSFEINNINFSAGTYDLYHNGILIKSGASMWVANQYPNVLRLGTGDAANNDTYIDNVLVRNFRAAEPTFVSWGGEEPQTVGWLSGYGYRKLVTLSRASGVVANYQMKLLVGESTGATGEDVDCAGHVLSNFNDLRFTTSNGTTLLDYWIESITGVTPNQLATVWIEFDFISTGDTTFYMYYGNVEAEAISNGVNTFIIFDDFDDSSVNTTLWDVITVGTGTVTESGTTIKCDPAGVGLNAEAKILSDILRANNLRTKFKARFEASLVNRTYPACGMLDGSTENGGGFTDAFVLRGNALTAGQYAMSTRKDAGTILSTDADTYITDDGLTWVLLDFKYLSQNCVLNIDGTDRVTHTTANQVPTTDLMHTFIGSVNNSSTGPDAEKWIEVDWVFIGQYFSAEPAFGSWGSEESEQEPSGMSFVIWIN